MHCRVRLSRNFALPANFVALTNDDVAVVARSATSSGEQASPDVFPQVLLISGVRFGAMVAPRFTFSRLRSL